MRLNMILGLSLALGLANSQASEPIKPEQFNKLHSLIKPNAEEEKFIDWELAV